MNYYDFANVNRKSKFAFGLKGILMALNEIIIFLDEATILSVPFQIVNNEIIHNVSFVDFGNLNNWSKPWPMNMTFKK